MASKHPRKDKVPDRNKRVKITEDMIGESLRKPRFMPPYFEHEPLDPKLYAGEWAKPCVEVSTNHLTYDIDSVPDVEDEVEEDEDDEEEIERVGFTKVFNSMLSRTNEKETNEPSTAPAPASDADRVVVGPRPVEGKGKKICGLDNMDEDDKLIYYLKLAKWTERAIHDKFMAEGRIGYNQKTIGTRFARMRRLIMSENDQRLKKGTAVWLEDEENLLPEAVAYATEQIKKERLALRQRKWELVSEFIQKREPLAMYSADACREHYETMLTRDDDYTAPSSDPKVSKLEMERQKQNAMLEHFKRSESL